MMLFLLLFPFALNAQTKRALVIGIGEYEDKAWSKINGDKDVALVRTYLSNAGYTDVKFLVNKNATKKNILNSLERLKKECNRGDIVYIHFSGHGQQMTDFNNDEKDGLDECWIPYDAYLKCCEHDKGEKHLTDDELNAIFHTIKTKIGLNGKMLVVVDACHSGDSSRGNDSTVYRGTRDMFYPSEDTFLQFADTRSEKWIILSACRDYQRNAELSTPRGNYGKLTYALYTILKENKKLNNTSLFNHLCDFFDENRGVLQQTPVMKGLLSNFNITEIL